MLETKETHINQSTNQSMLQMLEKIKQTNQPTNFSQPTYQAGQGPRFFLNHGKTSTFSGILLIPKHLNCGRISSNSRVG